MRFAALLEVELSRLVTFAFFMCGSRDEAFRQILMIAGELARDEATQAAVLAAISPEDALVGQVARRLELSLGRKAETSFRILDNLLRNEESRPITDLPNAGVLLWELKRSCLAAALGCLPPGIRVAYLLADVLGCGVGRAAELLDIKESAIRVRLTRARRRLEDFLAPRCGHMDRHNPCHCDGRLQLALDAGFVRLPPPADVPALDFHQGPQTDVTELYQGLPTVHLTGEQHLAILGVFSSE